MIVIRPGTLAWDALALIVAHPGEYTVDGIVRELGLVKAPPKPVLVPLAGPVRAAADMAEWRARAAAWNTEVAAWRGACDELRAVQRVKVARALGRLVEAGLVAKLAPPTLSPEFVQAVKEGYSTPVALRRFHPAWPGKVVNDGEALHLRLIARAGSGNCSTRAVLGDKPSGTVLRAYSELVRWGVLIAPQQRTATAAGVALVSAPALRVVA